VRRFRWHHLGDLYLSSRHCANTTLHTISLICRIRQIRREPSRYGSHHDQNVQDRRWCPRVVSGHPSDGGRCGTLCTSALCIDAGTSFMSDWMQVGLNFMVYESIRTYFTPVGDKNPVWYRKLAAGAISGAVAQTCTYPLYV
jgi:hypothetical protein